MKVCGFSPQIPTRGIKGFVTLAIISELLKKGLTARAYVVSPDFIPLCYNQGITGHNRLRLLQI